jgi:hypothetical protein
MVFSFDHNVKSSGGGEGGSGCIIFMITIVVVAGKRALYIHYRTKPRESLALTYTDH